MEKLIVEFNIVGVNTTTTDPLEVAEDITDFFYVKRRYGVTVAIASCRWENSK